MELLALLALRVPASALGLDEARYQAVLTLAVTRAESAAASVDDVERRAQAVEAHALAFMYDLEYEAWRRVYNGGSAPDGSFSIAEISDRMAAAGKARDAQTALFDAIVPPAAAPTPAYTRASGSVPITFEG